MSNVRKLIDMMGREVDTHFPPKRIISLVPSQTEFLLDIDAPVVGRTKFCIHPADKVSEIPVIGGTKNFRLDTIRKLKPDLIIGNKEENYQEGIEELAKDFPVWMSDIYTLEHAFTMMAALGSICNLEEPSDQIIQTCRKAIEEIEGSKSGKVVYLIWKNPWIVAGKDTFIDEMLGHLGYENLVKEVRYPQLSDSQIASLKPDKILFSSEPYPFKEKHLKQAQRQWPDADLELVDGELYSWYGSRLKKWI